MSYFYKCFKKCIYQIIGWKFANSFNDMILCYGRYRMHLCWIYFVSSCPTGPVSTDEAGGLRRIEIRLHSRITGRRLPLADGLASILFDLQCVGDFFVARDIAFQILTFNSFELKCHNQCTLGAICYFVEFVFPKASMYICPDTFVFTYMYTNGTTIHIWNSPIVLSVYSVRLLHVMESFWLSGVRFTSPPTTTTDHQGSLLQICFNVNPIMDK